MVLVCAALSRRWHACPETVQAWHVLVSTASAAELNKVKVLRVLGPCVASRRSKPGEKSIGFWRLVSSGGQCPPYAQMDFIQRLSASMKAVRRVSVSALMRPNALAEGTAAWAKK